MRTCSGAASPVPALSRPQMYLRSRGSESGQVRAKAEAGASPEGWEDGGRPAAPGVWTGGYMQQPAGLGANRKISIAPRKFANRRRSPHWPLTTSGLDVSPQASAHQAAAAQPMLVPVVVEQRVPQAPQQAPVASTSAVETHEQAMNVAPSSQARIPEDVWRSGVADACSRCAKPKALRELSP